MPNDPTTDQRTAVLARLTRAYAEIALCEAWLAQQNTRRFEHRVAAAAASRRNVQLSQEAE